VHRLKNWQLFAVCVVVWGTTWHAITYQVGQVAPEFGVALRFGLAGVLMFIGLKMIWLNQLFEDGFPIAWSLGIIAALVGGSIVASLAVEDRRGRRIS